MEDVLVQPTERDLEVLQEWWVRVAPEVPPEAKGPWFGITDLVHGGALRTLYLAGCPTFDSADSIGDWATEYCWWPADRYVTLADFARLPDQPYQDVLAYAAACVSSLDRSHESRGCGRGGGRLRRRRPGHPVERTPLPLSVRRVRPCRCPARACSPHSCVGYASATRQQGATRGVVGLRSGGSA
jgi:hypothetical protein